MGGELTAKCCLSIQPGPVIWAQRRDVPWGRLRWSCVRSRAAAALSYSRPLTNYNSIDNSPLTVDDVIDRTRALNATTVPSIAYSCVLLGAPNYV